MVNAVLKAGRGLARDFGEVENLQVSLKGPGDFVSAADRKAEEVLMAELGRARPGFGFLAEESGETAGTDRQNRWIIDPLDGTMNFLHGIPIFAISVALEREGAVVAGVVYNPILNELYVAEKGSGAFLNDRRLRVARRSKLEECVVATAMPQLNRPKQTEYLAELRQRSPGSPACAAPDRRRSTSPGWRPAASTASGSTISRPGTSRPSTLFVREAGGFVTDAAGGDASFATGTVVAGNETIHRQLLALLKGAGDA